MLFNGLPNTNVSVNRSSKVVPITVKPTQRNNYVPSKTVSAIQTIKYQVCTALVFGINRLYLFKPNTFVLLLSYVYTIFLPILVWDIMFNADDLSATYFVFKYTCCIEYVLLISISVFTSRSKLVNLLRDLDKFDSLLNIRKDLKVIDSGYISVFWFCGCFIYSLCEYICCYFYLTVFIDRSVYCLYVMMLAHDCEQILFFVLLRTIYTRLRVIKAHVLKVFSAENRTNNYRRKLDKVEALSNNAQLDISSLHRVYDLLHKCAEQLNSIMSLSMMIILLTAGLSTTMLLKMMVKVIQTVTVSNSFGKSTIIYLLGRGMKYTGLVVVPCYYSRVTSSQVAAIRTCLHDAVNSHPLDKIERRKVKAFFQLTRENEFSYALGGVIRLNMSLPLSYMSLCTTYLVISIQFSKFFD
nr:uncharacterized protein LOC126053903 [Helicoverpa armigera]